MQTESSITEQYNMQTESSITEQCNMQKLFHLPRADLEAVAFKRRTNNAQTTHT
jgi:hypothetical protein